MLVLTILENAGIQVVLDPRGQLEHIDMRQELRIILAVAAFWITGAVGLVLGSALRRYRTDLKPDQNAYEGASSIPMVNYLSPGNYSKDGLVLLRWFWVWHAAMPIAIVTALWLVMSTW